MFGTCGVTAACDIIAVTGRIWVGGIAAGDCILISAGVETSSGMLGALDGDVMLTLFKGQADIATKGVSSDLSTAIEGIGAVTS